jgi:glycosyltransferase involved in cell wall biosynthesis
MRILALIAARNEERFLGGCLEHLVSQGVEAYLCDDGSTDGTLDIAERYLGRGLRGIERRAHDGTYRWESLLRRKEELALELDADWYLHLDADEIPLAPRPGTTLAEALAEVDARGDNAVELAELTFVPTREAPDHDHGDFRRTMRWYYPFAPTPLHLVRGWKRQPDRVDLATTGGHAVGFPGRRISPERFRLCHYLFLSRDHAARKYGRRRFDAGEVGERRWHGWRPSFAAESLRLPSQADLRAVRDGEPVDVSDPETRHCVVWPQRPGTRPSLLFVVDRPRWAQDRKARALAAALATRYDASVRHHHDLAGDDIGRADVVLLFYWQQVERLGDLGSKVRDARDRLLIGASSPWELEGPWRDQGTATLSRLARAVFANNLALARGLRAALGRPVFYTPNGVDTSFFRPGRRRREERGRLVVGWAGSLANQGSEHRGVHEVLAPAVAAVAGAELRIAAREDRWRDRDEMRDFFASIDVYACASRSEGTPNGCLEAAACGLPVVTTPVGNMPELLHHGENGLLVPREVDAFAEALTLLRDDPALAARMGRNARSAVERWDWRYQAAHFEAMLRAYFSGALPRHEP